MAQTIVVWLETRDPERAQEALRAALGLTLRGGNVIVVAAHELPAQAAQLAQTIAALGHRVTTTPVLGDVTEIWT